MKKINKYKPKPETLRGNNANCLLTAVLFCGAAWIRNINLKLYNMKQNELLNKRIEIVEEMEQEIERARKKHGNQNHLPSLHKDLLNRDALRMCEEYEIPSEARAKFLTDDSFKYKKLTHAHILIEELVEAISCMKDEKKMRKELIQVMAMTMNWIVSIDAKHKKS